MMVYSMPLDQYAYAEDALTGLTLALHIHLSFSEQMPPIHPLAHSCVFA